MDITHGEVVEFIIGAVIAVMLYAAIYYEHKHKDGHPSDYAFPAHMKWVLLIIFFQHVVMEDYFSILASVS
jgi:hypothetical protein